MSYNLNSLQQQLQDLSRQYQQLAGQQPQPIFQQPMAQPQISIPVPPRQVQYVEGLRGAQLYQESMQPNSSEIIMDKDENIFYHVSKDANGTPARRIPVCRFTIEEQTEEPVFLTRKDLDDFKEEIRQMFVSSTGKTSTSTPTAPTTAKKT